MKNSNKYTIYTAISSLILGVFLGWAFFGDSSQEESNKIDHEHSENTTWTCSMHPQIRQNEPGQCPLCGMDLIPLSEDTDHQGDAMEIKMSPTAIQLANIQTSIITKKIPIKKLKLNGKVKPDERYINSQSSHIPGRVQKLMVNFTGEHVKKGQILAYVYSPELVVAQEELFEAYKIKDTQPGLYQAAFDKLKNWKLTEKQIYGILDQNTIQEEFPILADVSGVILDKKLNRGDYIKKGQTLFEIANLNKIWVMLEVYESDIAWVNIADPVKISVASIPGKTYPGKISFIDPVINPETRVTYARVEIDNQDLLLKPEMLVSAVIDGHLDKAKESLIVPKSAVMWTGERSVVYTKNESESGVSFTIKRISLGPALGESYVVNSGLELGDEVATNGTFSIDAAAQLAGKPSMMNPEGGATPTTHHHHGSKPISQNNDLNESSDAISFSAEAKEELQPLFLNYFKLKDALVNDNLDKAVKMSKEMKSVLNKINMGAFKGAEHHLWMKHNKVLEDEINKTINYKDLDQLRASFKIISEQLIQLTIASGGMKQNVYVDFCSMADNNKGAAWLSKEKEIKNPYFGASMLNCGEVKQKINKAQ